MVKIGDIDMRDKKFWPSEPEPGFNPERNKQVIEGTIKKYEAQRLARMRLFVKGLKERTDAIASYLTSPKVGKPLERYFGKRYLAELRGQDITNELRQLTRPSLNLKKKIIKGETFKLHGQKSQKEY